MTRRRFFWWIYARIYDQLWDTPHLGEVCAHIDSVLPAGAPVADIGAGTGIVTERLVRSGRAVVAYEPNSAMARQFVRRGAAASLVRVGLDELTPPQACDVVAVNVLHLLDDPVSGLRRLREVCGPNHVVVVVTPHPSAGLIDVASAQRRAGTHPLRVGRFVLWHVLLAPLSVLCGMPSRIRLDWFRGIDGPFGEPRPVGDTYLMLVIPGMHGPR